MSPALGDDRSGEAIKVKDIRVVVGRNNNLIVTIMSGVEDPYSLLLPSTMAFNRLGSCIF